MIFFLLFFQFFDFVVDFLIFFNFFGLGREIFVHFFDFGDVFFFCFVFGFVFWVKEKIFLVLICLFHVFCFF